MVSILMMTCYELGFFVIWLLASLYHKLTAVLNS